MCMRVYVSVCGGVEEGLRGRIRKGSKENVWNRNKIKKNKKIKKR